MEMECSLPGRLEIVHIKESVTPRIALGKLRDGDKEVLVDYGPNYLGRDCIIRFPLPNPHKPYTISQFPKFPTN